MICRRSKLMTRISGGGGMAAVELPGPQVLSELSIRGIRTSSCRSSRLRRRLWSAVPPDTIRELVASWESNGVMAREVAVDVASHSPHVEPILEDPGCARRHRTARAAGAVLLGHAVGSA